MAEPAPSKRIIRFGVFEVDLAAGELHRNGLRVRLQEKPFQVLALLLERPGEVVTREELAKRLWPDTFVDVEHSLTTAIKKLRDALEDPADNPRFVETRPGRGYRFIAPIEQGEELAWASAAARRSRKVWRWAVLGVAAVVLTALAGFMLSHRSATQQSLPFRQLTFRQGNITAGRFAPDGHTIVYSAAWDGKPLDIFTTTTDGPESRPLGLGNAGIFSISSAGEMAIALGCELSFGECQGTLARLPLAGGAAREILDHVSRADWAPDGKALAVVHAAEGKHRLEYPIGKVLYEASGWISAVRFSREGDLIAFADHPVLGDNGGSVCVVDLSGKKKTLSTGWANLYGGLAWSPAGDEVWFTGSKTSNRDPNGLFAVTLSGHERAILRAPIPLRLHDVSRDGHVLIDRFTRRTRLISLRPGATKEQDVHLFDSSTAADLSADGRTLLFYEWKMAGEGNLTVYLRKTDGSDAVRLGEGKPLALSPDGRWALVKQQSFAPQLMLLPTGPGRQRLLPRGAVKEYYDWAAWSPDSSRIFFAGAESGYRGTYMQDIEDGPPRAVTPDGMIGTLLSPDGKLIAAVGRYAEYYLCPVDGGEPRPIDGLLDGDALVAWSSNGRSLFVRGAGDMVLRVFKLDLLSGRRELWKELHPPDPVGLIGIGADPGEVRITPDGKSYVYTCWTFLNDLFLAEGLK